MNKIDVLIVGSVALDDVRTPHGEVGNALGGSAVYASLAASYFTRVGIVGVIGEDFPPAHIQLLNSHRIELTGLEQVKGKTFHWAGYYEGDMNTAYTTETQLNVLEHFVPKIPEHLTRTPYLFLANIDPELQANVLQQMRRPRFVLLDTMNYWIQNKREKLLEVMRKVDLVVVNEGEARQLAHEHHLVRAAYWICQQGPKGVMIKKGEHGALLLWKNRLGMIPGFPVVAVKDPTGAGDTFAGGLIGTLSQQKKLNAQALKTAAALGSVMASFTIEDFSVNKILHVPWSKVQSRYQKLRSLVTLPDIPKIQKRSLPSPGRRKKNRKPAMEPHGHSPWSHL